MKATTYSILACNYLADALKHRQEMEHIENMIVGAIRQNGEVAPEMVARLAAWEKLSEKGDTSALDIACVMRVKLEAEVVYGGFAQAGYKNICRATRIFRDAALTLKAAEAMKAAGEV